MARDKISSSGESNSVACIRDRLFIQRPFAITTLLSWNASPNRLFGIVEVQGPDKGIFHRSWSQGGVQQLPVAITHALVSGSIS